MNDDSLDPLLVAAVQQQESGGDPDAVSSKGAIGAMQTLPTTLAKPGYGVTPAQDDSDAERQRVGKDYLQAMHNKYGDQNLALMAYNWGPGAVDNWIADGQKPQAVPAETKDYVKNVNKIHQQLQAGNQMAENQPMDEDEQLAQEALKKQQPNTVLPSAQSDPVDEDEQLAKKALQDQQTKSATQTAEAKKPPVSTTADVAESLPTGVVKGINELPQNALNTANFALKVGTQINNKLQNGYEYLTGGNPLTADQQAKNIADTGFNYKVPTLNELSGGRLSKIAAGTAASIMNPLMGNNLSESDIVDTAKNYTPEQAQNSLHQPQTGAGQTAENVASVVPSALLGGQNALRAAGGYAGFNAADKIDPNNPLLQAAGAAIGGGLVKGGENALTPKPLPTDVATVIKGAKDDFGIDTPASAMTNGSNLIEKIASKADTQDLTGQVNKAAADMIGANDNGEGHTVINQKSYLDAAKNNSAAYDKVFADIGDIPIDKQIVPILQEVENAGDTPRFRSVLVSIQSKLNPNGTLPASAYKELTKVGANGKASVLQQMASSTTDTDASIAAKNILDHLESALKDKATPEQQAALSAVDTRYKMMKTVKPIARQVGAGQQAAIPSIQGALNTKFNNINGTQSPPVQLSNYLNTVNAGNKATGGFSGLKNTPAGGNSLLDTSEMAAAIASGHPALATLPIIQKGAMYGASKAASRFINTDWYKNRLLSGAQ